jgi:hypothetical protein
MAEKTREQRLRFELDKIGFRLMRSRVRNQDDPTYGRYFIVDPERNLLMTGPGTEDGVELDAVERWLADNKP